MGVAMHESKEERLARIRRDWKHWQDKLNGERKARVVVPQIKGLANGSNKETQRKLLRSFWGNWENLQTDELKLHSLIHMARQFPPILTPKRLRKIRRRYEKNKFFLLNIPNEKCGTCDVKANVRHHIIPLSGGGLNSPLNLILICDGCHEKIHPWMKGRR